MLWVAGFAWGRMVEVRGSGAVASPFVAAFALVRLTSLQIAGFKRFGETATLRVRSRSLALLGPNESGKTTVLEALEHLGRDGFPAATQFTDRQRRNGSDVVLSGRFTLETEDVRAVRDLLDGRPVSGLIDFDEPFTITKQANGKRYFRWKVAAERDISGRQQFVTDVQEELGRDLASLPLAAYDKAQLAGVRDVLQLIPTGLKGVEREQLETEELAVLRNAQGTLESWATQLGQPDAFLNDWRDRISRLIDEESEAAPRIAAGRLLFTRLPRFLRFDDDARRLPTFTEFTAKPSGGLTNLLAAAQSSFQDLATLAGQQSGREALAEEERRINLLLERLFRSWSQRDVTAAVKIDTTGVEVVGRDRSAPLIDSPMGQRSAGMQMFAALLAFLHTEEAESDSRAVVLIDEAEMHLHYDAQADLVRVFDRQDVAQVVIYTTHSIGCLPEDLGLGIVVVEETDDERSRLSQSFWTQGPGLTPIMAALGATALAFTPARRVVIGEGAHEAILLPTLLRESREHDQITEPLGFQVVGGLSEISARTAHALEEEAGTVVYLVDNDGGGSAVRAILPDTARDAGRVLVLGDGTDVVSIEDLVSATVFVAAIDAVLAGDRCEPLQIAEADVPQTGRAKWALAHLVEGGSPEARTRLAQAAVTIGSDRRLLEPSRAESVRSLLSLIRATFPTGGS